METVGWCVENVERLSGEVWEIYKTRTDAGEATDMLLIEDDTEAVKLLDPCAVGPLRNSQTSVFTSRSAGCRIRGSLEADMPARRTEPARAMSTRF